MEAKLEIPPLLKFLQASPCLSFPSYCFGLKSWVTKKRSFNKRFRGLAETWKFQIEELRKGQDCSNSKHYLIHVVKRGETLASISKQYGASMYTIAAANKSVMDIDLVVEGRLLIVPGSANEKVQYENSGFLGSSSPERSQSSSNGLDGHLRRKIFTVLCSHPLPHAKTTGYFLVLVPLIAFCIRCIIGAFHNRITGERKIVDALKAPHSGSKSVRWKSALSDITDPDNSDAGSSDSIPPEDQVQLPSQEMSRAYTKLEHDYQRFLSECGMSSRGYWRGGDE